jgi:isoprenylcysteine carboxyl methyltransferase (ICMT) family protein YpbQ
MQGTSGAPSLAARACAWGGTLLFFVSLSYFLYAYVVTYGEMPPSSGATQTVAVDVLLFTGFALHHSVFARERVRTWVARTVPPTLERSLYVWIASALFLAVCALWQPVPGVAWMVVGPLRWLLVAVQAAAVWLILRSAAMLDILELSGVRQLSATPRDVVFKTSGPYGWIRHPIYTGWMLFVFCAPTMTMTRLVFAVVSSAYLVMAIPFEERTLMATSAGDYERYSHRVRWKLIPGLY